ncbi:MAG: hypothetical protein ACI8RD_002681 [Bacillariaceae sp.]|jgi:hypothetical protein
MYPAATVSHELFKIVWGMYIILASRLSDSIFGREPVE